jgi:hypothetical protein
VHVGGELSLGVKLQIFYLYTAHRTPHTTEQHHTAAISLPLLSMIG